MPSEAEDLARLLPSGLLAQSEAGTELAAVLTRAAANIELDRNPPPCSEGSRLDN